MSEILKKSIKTEVGNLQYYISSQERQKDHILFIHGIGENKEWFPKQYERYNLNMFSWIVPDLMGYGDSTKPKKKESYTMDNQAEYLLHLLAEENIESVIIIAHSMGGPIGISLLEKLVTNNTIKKVKPQAIVYLEGNLDKNDAFLSSLIAQQSFDEFNKNFKLWVTNNFTEYDLANKILQAGAFTLWASSIDLVKVSSSNLLLPRLQKLIDNHDINAFFIFGEKNKGIFTSESLIRKAQLPILFIPKTGHLMHLEQPKIFWMEIKKIIV